MGSAAFTGDPDRKDVTAFEGRLGDDLETLDPNLEAQDTEDEQVSEPAAEDEPAEEVEEEPAAEASAEAVVEAEEESTISTLSDLADAYGVDESTLRQTIQVTIGDDTVSLDEALQAHTANPAAARELAELQQERTQFTTEVNASRKAVGETMAELAAHAQVFANDLEEQFKDIDWARLKEEDPSRYLLLRNERQEGEQKFRNAVDVIHRADEQRQKQEREHMAQFEAIETQTLLTKMPQWRDPEVGKAAMTGVNAFLIGQGFQPEEIRLINDHRYMLVAHQAYLYSQLKTKAPKTLGKLKGLPKPTKVMGATARREAASVKTQKKTQATTMRARLKETGDERDAAAIFEQEVDFDGPAKRP